MTICGIRYILYGLIICAIRYILYVQIISAYSLYLTCSVLRENIKRRTRIVLFLRLLQVEIYCNLTSLLFLSKQLLIVAFN